MLCNFYVTKNHKIATNSTTTEAVEKISADLKSLKFKKYFNVHLAKLKNNQILQNKIYHRYLMTAQLITGCNIQIEINGVHLVKKME